LANSAPAFQNRTSPCNHRSGALLVSYLLMRKGLPPFVLTVDNAESFFNPSSIIRKVSKHSAMALFKMAKIKK